VLQGAAVSAGLAVAATTVAPKAKAAAAVNSAVPAAAAGLPLDDTSYVAGGDRMTTNQGVPLSTDENTLKAGSRGPSLLEDFAFREKITHFDHERVPERAVHARGAGAHGVFTLSKSLDAFTSAKVLTEVGVDVPVFVRFSTVNGSRGSADTVRDARGFATKFYTSEGNWDIVGNNIPVFFIQDAIKFPDLVHSFKPQPAREIPQASTAHDNFWDFISLAPETMHMVMWAMSDRAIPRSFRMMDGAAVHTFRLVKGGKATFVKFHWRPKLGVHSLIWDESNKVMAADPDFHRRDLADAIAAGAKPQWDLAVQLLAEGDVGKLGVDVLDPTKLWPEESVPLQVVGTMTLDRNPSNFFEETEQVAFCPSHIVPGIDITEDPLLQGRLFSYLDTQVNRFNSANFAQLPINRPRANVNNFQQDGYMRYDNRDGDVNYSPNSLGAQVPAKNGFVSYPGVLSGGKTRERSETFGDHFSQARMFYVSLADWEQLHIVQAFQFELTKVMSADVRKRVLTLLANVDADLTKKVADYLGLPAPAGKPNTSVQPSPSLSMAKQPSSAATRKVAVLVSDDVKESDVKAVQDALKAAGATWEVIGTHLGPQNEAKGVVATQTYDTTMSVLYDAVFVPGGQKGRALLSNGKAVHFIEEAFAHFKPLAVAGETKDMGRVAAKKETPGVFVGADGAAVAKDFVAGLATGRYWNRDVSAVS
jgi:catalase